MHSSPPSTEQIFLTPHFPQLFVFLRTEVISAEGEILLIVRQSEGALSSTSSKVGLPSLDSTGALEIGQEAPKPDSDADSSTSS